MILEPATAAAPQAFDQPVGETLLARARARDRGAQEALYRQFERPVYSLLRRMTGCPDTAADLLQDSFLHAFQHLHQFRGDAPFGRWLRSIAATQALMHLRAGRRFMQLFVSGDEIAVEHYGIEDLSNHDLETLLALLPELPRAVLWLYHVEGYSHIEIAALAGKTVSFSKSQLSRAHQKLRLLLDEPARTPAVRASLPEPPR